MPMPIHRRGIDPMVIAFENAQKTLLTNATSRSDPMPLGKQQHQLMGGYMHYSTPRAME
jgi:hypothetical protein